MATEVLTVARAFCPLDLLLLIRFGREVPGLEERTLDLNPGLAALGPFLPVGTRVTVEIPQARRAPSRPLVTLYTA